MCSAFSIWQADTISADDHLKSALKGVTLWQGFCKTGRDLRLGDSSSMAIIEMELD